MTRLVCTAILWAGLMFSCAAPKDQAKTYNVKYEVRGIMGAKLASLTYTNDTGSTEQREVSLPWTKSLVVNYGAFLYLSAQNKNEEGIITADISVNGTIQKTATSDGAFVISSVNYRCCE